MGQPACRVGDLCTGICYAHGIPIPFTAVYIQGAATIINGTNRINVGGLAASSCGHMMVANTGSGTVLLELSPAHRVSDLVTGPGTGVCTQGSTNVMTGG